MKYTHYVAWIDCDNQLHFVTKIDTKTKSWFAMKGEKAMRFSKTAADDLMFGMRCNGITAVVVKAPDFAEYINN